MDNEFIKIYNEMFEDKSRQNNFCSGALRQDKRLFRIFDSNLKTCNTYYKYLYDVVKRPEIDNHQKITKLKDIKLYSDSQNDKIVKTRSSIALKINSAVEENSFLRDLIMFAFMLDSSVDINESAEFITDVLPEDIFFHYNDYLKSAYKEQTILNPVYGLYVFYSDKEFLYQYINYISNLDDEKRNCLKKINDDRNNYINSRRIKDVQKGSFLNEALIGALYFKLCEMNLEGICGYSNIINKLLNEYKKLIQYLEIPNMPEESEWIKIEKLLNELTSDEKNELLRSFGNISDNANKYEQGSEQKSIRMIHSFGQGHDVMRTAKSRIGQTKFRRNLIEQMGTCKCRIKECNINRVDFLRASHILEWKYSSAEQKTDPNNGLLLCPVHDFLFDGHFITFDDTGNINISKEILPEFYKDFNISEDMSIDVYDGNKEYLAIHRHIFEKNNE